MSEQDLLSSKPIHEVIPAIEAACRLQVIGNIDIAIPYLQGPPGIAKTAMIRQMSKQNQWNLVHIHYGLKPIEEVSGIPQFVNIEIPNFYGEGVTKDLGTIWSNPDVLTEIYRVSNKNPSTITVLFMDDMHRASPAVISLGYEMFSDDKKLRGRQIPPNVAFVLAGNTSSESGAETLFSAIVNRCQMLPVHMDFKYWKENYAHKSNINSKILSFLNNSAYQRFAQEKEQVNIPWASYRSWTRFSNLLNIMEENIGIVSPSDILYYSAAHVGQQAATEFMTYYELFSKVETEKIFDEKIDISVPSDMANKYIYIMACVVEFFNRYINDKTKKKSIEVMSKIMIETSKTASHFAVKAAKDIILTEAALDQIRRKDAFVLLSNQMKSIDSEINEKIKEDIRKI